MHLANHRFTISLAKRIEFIEEMRTWQCEAVNEDATRDGRAIAVTTKVSRTAVKGVSVSEDRTGKARVHAVATGARRTTGARRAVAGANRRTRASSAELERDRNRVNTVKAAAAANGAAARVRAAAMAAADTAAAEGTVEATA
jgi:hypothetical protein